MKKFLVIQQKMIGDVLVSTILCEHIKIHFPEAEVHYLINEHTTAVVEGNPFIDKIVLFENRFKKNKYQFYKFLKNINRENYNVVIDVYSKIESNLITFYSNASIKISFKKWYSSFFYDYLFVPVKNSKSKIGLVIEDRTKLLSPIIPELKEPKIAPKISLSEKEVETAKEFLKFHKIDTSKKMIMIGILGSSPNKSYPLEYLAKVIDYITEEHDVTLLFNYLPSQENSVNALLSFCSSKSRKAIKEKVYCSSLRSFLGVLSICDAYIGNEGGASNMSKALNIPNFSIFSPWISKEAWSTYKQNKANVSVHLADYLGDDFDKIPKKERKKNSLELYQLYKPEYIKEELLEFIENQIFSYH